MVRGIHNTRAHSESQVNAINFHCEYAKIFVIIWRVEPLNYTPHLEAFFRQHFLDNGSIDDAERCVMWKDLVEICQLKYSLIVAGPCLSRKFTS